MKKVHVSPITVLLAYLTLCFVCVPTQASAYIDPSTTTFLVQAVVGVAVAVAAGFSIYWRKAKKKISKVLNVDENAGKETESDDIVVNIDNK